MMKKVLIVPIILTFIICMLFGMSVSAVEPSIKTYVSVEKLENGDSIKTYITCYETDARAATKSGSKTKEYENSNGETLWTVTVYGTFTYNGTTSSCTSVSHSTTAPGSDWTIKSSSSSRSGNCATAYATATKKNFLSSKDYSMSVSLYCSPYGILS